MPSAYSEIQKSVLTVDYLQKGICAVYKIFVQILC